MTRTRRHSLAHWAAVNCKALRKSSGMPQEQLAEQMTMVGVETSRDTIASLESQRRSDLTLDEVAALAVVFNVRLCDLLAPPEDDGTVEVIPGMSARAERVRAWLAGEVPLMGEDDEVQFFRKAPAWRRAEHRVALDRSMLALTSLRTVMRTALVSDFSNVSPALLAEGLESELERVTLFAKDLAAELRKTAATEEGN